MSICLWTSACRTDGSGMECVRTLRENGYEGSIIFQSSSAEHTVEAFQVDAIQYLLKPVSQEQLFAAVGKLNRYRKTRRKMETGEQPFSSADKMTSAKRRTYRYTVEFFIDTLLAKWNSHKNG